MSEVREPPTVSGSESSLFSWRYVVFPLMWGLLIPLTSMYFMFVAWANVSASGGESVAPGYIVGFLAGAGAGTLIMRLAGERWLVGIVATVLTAAAVFVIPVALPHAAVFVPLIALPVVPALLYSRWPQRYRYWLLGFLVLSVIVAAWRPYDTVGAQLLAEFFPAY